MPQENRDSFFTELLKFAVIALVIVVPIRFFVAQPFIVSGASMDPTFATGQYLIVDELSYRLEPADRGDVIIFKYPKDPTQYFIKRVIGLPGETVQIKNGDVYIAKPSSDAQAEPQFVKLDEPYIINKGNGADMTVTLNSDEYFVMGDNRPESSDSRTWGTLPRENIIGRAMVRLLPLQTISIFPGKATIQTN
jgi:signal peptidase I